MAIAVTEPTITKPGIYNVAGEVYHGNSFPAPCLSSGIIKKLLMCCPKAAWVNHPALNPDYAEATKEQFDIGTTAHSLLLEGLDNAVIIEANDWKTNAAKAARDAARADGFIPLLPKQYAMVTAMVTAAKRQLAESELHIKDLQAEGVSEQSWIWQEGDTWLKIRPDWMTNEGDIILDYKTTGTSANPEGIGRHILNMGFDIQEALYRRGVYALKQKMPKFVFMFQETSKPCLCSFPSLPPQWQAYADWKVEKGIEIWRECLKANDWPGYPLQVCYPDLPAYEFAKWEGERIMEADGV